MAKCPICIKDITFLNKPGFGLGKMNNDEIICSNCLLQLKEIDQLVVLSLKNYSADDLKQIISSRRPVLDKLSKQIADLKIEARYLFAVKKELAELPGIISQDENIDALVTGIYDNGNGILVATDKRLLFVDKGLFFGLKIEDFGLDKVSSIQYEGGLLLADIKIMASGNLAKITHVDKTKAREFCEKVRSKLSETKISSVSVVQGQVDVIEQLRKLATLKEQGFLTDDEFDSQKKKLLNL